MSVIFYLYFLLYFLHDMYNKMVFVTFLVELINMLFEC